MDDSSLFMQWAMDTLHQQHPSAAAAAAPAYTDGGGGEGASFPSLQALRSASQTTAAAGVRDLTVQVDHWASSWSSGDSPGAAMDHDAAAGWSPHTARARTGGGGGNRPTSWNFSAASAQPTDESGGGVALPDAAGAPRAHTPVGKRGGSVAPAAAGGSAATAAPSGYVQEHVIAERRRREKINRRFIELSTVIPGLKKVHLYTPVSLFLSFD